MIGTYWVRGEKGDKRCSGSEMVSRRSICNSDEGDSEGKRREAREVKMMIMIIMMMTVSIMMMMMTLILIIREAIHISSF